MQTRFTQMEEERKRILAECDQRADAFIDQLKKHLEGLGHTFTSDLKEVNGIITGFSIIPEYKGSSWVLRPTGRLRMRMNDLHQYNSKNYPEPKKGFSVEKTTERLLNVVEYQRKVRKDREASAVKRKNAQSLFEKVCDDLGLEHTKGTFTAFPQEDCTLSVCSSKKVELIVRLTPEQLKVVLEALRYKDFYE